MQFLADKMISRISCGLLIIAQRFYLKSPLARDEHQHCARHNIGIQPDRPVANIVLIQFDALFKTGGVAPADLPHAGHSGADHLVELDALAIQGALLGKIGARPDQTHLALDDIDQLGKFIETELAQEATHAGDARVMPELLILFPFLLQGGVRLQQLRKHLIGIHAHGAKFQHAEGFAVTALAHLAVKDRAFRIQADEQGNESEDGRTSQQQDERAGQIAHALDQAGPPVEQVAADGEAEHALQVNGLDALAAHPTEGRNQDEVADAVIAIAAAEIELLLAHEMLQQFIGHFGHHQDDRFDLTAIGNGSQARTALIQAIHDQQRTHAQAQALVKEIHNVFALRARADHRHRLSPHIQAAGDDAGEPTAELDEEEGGQPGHQQHEAGVAGGGGLPKREGHHQEKADAGGEEELAQLLDRAQTHR